MFSKKYIVAGIAVITFFIIFSIIAASVKNNDEWTSTQLEEESLTYEDPYLDKDYAIINEKKEDWIGISEHSYIEKVTSVLNSYYGKEHTSFLFEDGTAISYANSRGCLSP